MASPYIASYVLHTADGDKDYGMRRDVDGTFRIGNSAVQIDRNSNVIVQGVPYKGTKGLFELLTRKKVDRSFITDRDMNSYRAILEATNAILKIMIPRVLYRRHVEPNIKTSFPNYFLRAGSHAVALRVLRGKSGPH